MNKEKELITAEDLYLMQLITAAEISPDGKNVILSVQTVDRETEKKYSNLFLHPIDSKQTKPFTSGKQNDSNPKYTPDGTKIIFISNRDNEKQAQFYQISTTGGEAIKISNLTGEIGDYLISPDNKKIYFQFRKKDQEVIEREKDEKKKQLGIVNRYTTRTFYRLDGYGYYPHERWHLWVLDLEDGSAKQLTDHEIFDETGPFLSPDQKTLGFFSNRSQEPDLDPDADDVFLLDLATLEFKKLATPEGSKRNAAFSPDGKWIVYTGQNGKGEGWRNTDLWIVSTDGKGEVVNLTRSFDIDINGSTLNDNGPAPAMTPVWSKDSRSIFYIVARHGNAVLEKISITDKKRETILSKPGVVGKASFDETQENLIFFFGQPLTMPQIFLHKLGTSSDQFTQLTTFNEDWLSNRDLGSLEEIWFKGSDGNDLQGWILTPPGFDPQKQYPSILEIHGGPLAQYGNFFMHEFFYLAAKGYVVYFCNPRGGQGYGEEHAKAIHGGKWGTKDYEDLMKWADYVQALPYIDQTRMGVTGGSYGGYMTAWIIGHTQRFKAAASQRCVSNLISMWGSSDFNWGFQEIFGDQAPYENIEILWENSPMKHIGNAKTPTLVIHSEQDLRCPLEQGQQLYTALKKLGIDTKFVIFPDEPHGLSRMGRTDRRIVRLEEISHWFETHL